MEMIHWILTESILVKACSKSKTGNIGRSTAWKMWGERRKTFNWVINTINLAD